MCMDKTEFILVRYAKAAVAIVGSVISGAFLMAGIGIAAIGALVAGTLLGIAVLASRKQPVPVRVRNTLNARRTARGWVVDAS